MSHWSLRPVVDADFPSLVAISNQGTLRPRSLEEFTRAEATRDRSHPSLRLAAIDAAGQVVGHGLLRRSPWRPEGRYWIDGYVDTAHQRMGVGRALLAATAS